MPHNNIRRDLKMAASLELEARLDNLLATAQAETADIDLFAPIPEREECPICMIPLPLREDETEFKICCGKNICIGCSYKQSMNDKKNRVPNHKKKCAFCRQLTHPKNKVKALKKLMKKNNSDAFMHMAKRHIQGEDIFQSNTKALEMMIRAAELGNANAFAMIGYYYLTGVAVTQNTSKALDYYEIAAKKGSVLST